MTFENVLDTFFLREDQDAFARAQGWEDAAQMCYYENLAMQEEGKSDATARIMGYESADAITEELNRMDREAASKQDALLHELAKQDSREVYEDMAGVY